MANLVDVTIRGDDETGPAFASVAARAAALKKTLADAGKINVGLDMSRLGTDLIGLRSKIQALGIADIADVNVQPGRVISQLQFLKRSIEQQKISDLLDVNVNQSTLAAQLASLRSLTTTIPINTQLNKALLASQLAALKSTSAAIPINFDVSKIPTLPTLGPTQNISDKFQIIGIAQAEAQLAALKAITASLDSNFAALTASTDKVNTSLVALAAAAGGAAGGQGGGNGAGLAGAAAGAAAAGRAIGGFGGVLGGTVGLISTFHLVLDLAVEGLIAVGTATAAAAVGIAAMTPAAQDIATHLQAVQTVNSALGSSIPPLTGQFQALAQAMAPQVIEAYGGALNLVTGQTGVFAKVAGEVVNLFDTWIAKIDIWAKSQNNFGGLLQAGVGFLSQFGEIIAKIGLALDNLIVKDPGTAHFLLDILNAAASLLDLITKLPAPILETALAMHSWYIYGGAAAGALSKLPGPLGAIGTALKGVNAVQLGVLAALATGAFEIVRAWDAASANVQKDINNTLSSLDQLSASQALITASADIGHFNQAIQSLSTSSIIQQFKGWGSTFQELDDRWISMGHDFEDVWNQFTKSGGSIIGIFKDLGNAFNLLTGNGDQAQIATVQLQHDISAYDNAIASVFKDQVNLGTELGDLTKGTTTWSYVVGEGTGKIRELGSGVVATTTGAYSFSEALALLDLAGVKANDSLAVMQQKVANLVEGYKEMSVSGGILAGAVNAVTFASELQSSKVSQLTGAYSAWFQLISGGVSSFDSFASAMNTLDGTLKLNTSNLGGLTAAQITAQQQFISTAGAAQTQFNSLVTLAAAAGQGTQGTNMLTQAMKDYMALLIPAAQNNDALRQTLVSMAQEVNPNITSFQQLTTWVGNVHQPMQNLDNITTIFTKDAGTLTTDVQNLSTALGTTLNQAMAAATLAATGGTTHMVDLANAILTTGLNSKTTQTDALSLAEQLTTLTGNTKSAHDEFIAFAENALHLTQTQAETLWHTTLPGLQGYIDSLHGKNIPITANLSGSGSVTVYPTPSGAAPTDTLYFKPAATGSYLSGGVPGQDSIPIMAQAGELVVPKPLVDAGYANNMRGMIPGFAFGGVVGSDPGNTLGNWVGDATQRWAQQDLAAIVAADIAAMKAAQAKAAAAAASSAGVSNASGIAAITSAAAKHGWFGPQLQAWFGVEAREDASMSLTATNPGSGAYGMAQFINGPSEYYQYGGDPNTYAGQATAMGNYIAQRYGTPEAALAHEISQGWYDNGGWLKPGWTMAYNGTGKPEPVGGPGGITVCLEIGSSGNQGFDAFMLEWIRNNVRIKGGGDVQQAFGRN